MRKDLVVFRCKSCIEDLKEYNPYVDKEGKKIPLASSTKMDCWFYIMEEVGRDIIWDVENNKILSIEDVWFGFKRKIWHRWHYKKRCDGYV